MAIYKMCSILDMVAQQYGRPFFAVSEGSAVRGFSDEVNNRESMLYKHPRDYQLFLLGTFDDEDGRCSLSDSPVLLASGAQFALGMSDFAGPQESGADAVKAKP